jgi:hypothetical protein
VPCFCLLYGGLYEEAEETIAAYSYQTVGLRFGYLRRRTIADRHRKQYSRRAA